MFNFVFSLDSFKFRPVAYVQYLIEHILFAGNYNGYVLYNIFLVLVLNYIFLLFFYEKSSLTLCLMLSLVLVTSKFFTYPIWNITGSFESLAAIIFLLIVLSFSDNELSKKKVVFLAMLLIFTSERYLPFLVVLPIIYRYMTIQDSFISSIRTGAKYSIAIMMAYFAFRYSMGVPLIVGTQTDNVVESFSGTRFAFHVIKAYGEIFGFSIGPTYLTGFQFVDWVPFNALIHDTIYIQGFFISLCLLIISAYYFIFKCYFFQNAVLGFNIISLVLVMAASITFRLELRWLLPSYLILLILFSTFRDFVKCEGASFNSVLFDKTIFFTFIFLSILNNVYYAIFFRRGLYFAEKLHDTSIIKTLWSFLHG